VCELEPRGLELELNFCRNIIAQNSLIATHKVDIAAGLAELDANEGYKQELGKKIDQGRQKLHAAESLARELTQQMQSDEITRKFLQESLSSLQIQVKDDAEELKAYTKECHDVRVKKLAELDRLQSHKADPIGEQAQVVKELRVCGWFSCVYMCV